MLKEKYINTCGKKTKLAFSSMSNMKAYSKSMDMIESCNGTKMSKFELCTKKTGLDLNTFSLC